MTCLPDAKVKAALVRTDERPYPLPTDSFGIGYFNVAKGSLAPGSRVVVVVARHFDGSVAGPPVYEPIGIGDSGPTARLRAWRTGISHQAGAPLPNDDYLYHYFSRPGLNCVYVPVRIGGAAAAPEPTEHATNRLTHHPLPSCIAMSHSPPPVEADGVADPEAAKLSTELNEYLCGLSEAQAAAYKIAYKTLGHSYSTVRSQGFLKWLEARRAAEATAADASPPAGDPAGDPA